MSNYVGYFKGVQSNILYSVKIIPEASSGSALFTEVKMAGSQPFVVTYNSSNDPFAPSRISTATAKFVTDDYLIDVYSPYAAGTIVTLKDETNNKVKWTGFLKPQTYNQGYEDCDEIISLEASDFVAYLQYIDYQPCNGTSKSIVSFLDIVSNILFRSKLINKLYIMKSKTNYDDTDLDFSSMKISEQNWFTSDTDEAMRCNEVLDEICKYLGMTYYQIGDALYIVDNTRLNMGNAVMKIYDRGTSSFTYTSATTINKTVELDANAYLGNGGSVSFSDVYNKATVNCNVYKVENVIPDILNEDILTSRSEGSSQLIKYADGYMMPFYAYTDDGWPAATPSFITFNKNKKQSTVTDADDEHNMYLLRALDNPFYESVYRDRNLNPITEDEEWFNGVLNVTENAIGGTIVELGTIKTGDNDYQVKSIDYKKYLLISTHNKPNVSNIPSSAVNRDTDWNGGYTDSQWVWPVYRTKSNAIAPASFTEKTSLIIQANALFTRYCNRPWINTEWSNEPSSPFANAAPHLMFRIKIGNKYWGGKHWKDTAESFHANLTITKVTDMPQNYNTELTLLNTVPWDAYIEEKGYRIPLEELYASGITSFEGMSFEVMLPVRTGGKNGFCWISDLEILCVQEGTENEYITKKEYEEGITNDNEDIVYENIIDENSLNELDEITLKLNTYTDRIGIAYSNVLLSNGGYLKTIREESNGMVNRCPEENLVSRYLHQFSTPTIGESVTISSTVDPLSMVYDPYWEKKFWIVGQEIDYQYDSQTVDLIEAKVVDDDRPEEIFSYTASTDSVSHYGGEVVIDINANVKWSGRTSSSAAVLSMGNGYGTGHEVTKVRIAEAPTSSSRPLWVEFTTENNTKYRITIIQNEMPTEDDKQLVYDSSNCINDTYECMSCAGIGDVCPAGVTVNFNYGKARINTDDCIGCSACADLVSRCGQSFGCLKLDSIN